MLLLSRVETFNVSGLGVFEVQIETLWSGFTAGGSQPNFSLIHENPPDGEIQLLRFVPSCCNSAAVEPRVHVAMLRNI